MTTQDCFFQTGATSTPCVIVQDNPNLDYFLGLYLFFGIVFGIIIIFKKRT